MLLYMRMLMILHNHKSAVACLSRWSMTSPLLLAKLRPFRLVTLKINVMMILEEFKMWFGQDADGTV
jgi:hypothetical protein